MLHFLDSDFLVVVVVQTHEYNVKEYHRIVDIDKLAPVGTVPCGTQIACYARRRDVVGTYLGVCPGPFSSIFCLQNLSSTFIEPEESTALYGALSCL
jgi:hypothetical protein